MLSKFAVSLLALAGLGASAVFETREHPIIVHEGDPVGYEKTYGNTTYYITGKKSDTAVLYLTDVFGIQLVQNKLLADSFGRAGFLTVAPDLFDGSPAPGDIVGDQPFDIPAFLAAHGPEVTDPKIVRTISVIREKLGVENIVVTGYCFGGRYTFRFLNGEYGIAAGFAAHPSLLEDDEILAITAPATVAAAESDQMMPPERRFAVEQLLQETGEAYTLALYSGTSHGFGVRADVTDPQQKFGKEEAFFQAVKFFKAWA